VRVQVTPTVTDGICPKCSRHGPLVSYTVFIGQGFTETEPVCQDCLENHAIGEYEPPKLDSSGPPSRRVQRNSRKREVAIAEDIGGRRQPGSGNTPFMKGDVRLKGVCRIEHKDCYGLEFKAHRKELFDKIRAECSPGEQPTVVVTFRDKITHEILEAWAMEPYEVWVEKLNVPRKNR
jgi:hypothetical protein